MSVQLPNMCHFCWLDLEDYPGMMLVPVIKEGTELRICDKDNPQCAFLCVDCIRAIKRLPFNDVLKNHEVPQLSDIWVPDETDEGQEDIEF